MDAGDERERWGTRIGLILAAAGNAIGIGNFLRFPSKAAASGGGAFIIPYVCALLFLGIPMMWVAWGIGRHGGKYGHTSTPGMFDRLCRHPSAKYLGVLGLAIPLSFAMYYTYIESWMLGYAWNSLTGHYASVSDYEIYADEYQGILSTGNWFQGYGTAILFAAITLGLNIAVLWRGVAKGIETLAKVAMPLLFVFAVVLMIKTLTLPAKEGTVTEGLAYVWKPDWSRIADVGIWVAAAGQIFYSLSIGMGSLECYAGYLREKDDMVLTGLTTSSTNEFVEVIMGGSIAIPATAVFLGSDRVIEIARGGTFNLGLVAMPQVLVEMGGVQIFGTMWFLLLFFAAFTSSVAVAQPIMAFYQDEMKVSRTKAVAWLAVLWTIGTIPCIFWAKYKFWEEIDFWAGTMGLIVFAFVEVILFAWVFGAARRAADAKMTTSDGVARGVVYGFEDGWEEMHRGADIRIPRIFYYIIKYVTPIYLLALLVLWPAQELGGVLDPSPRVKEGIANASQLKKPVLVAKNKGALTDEVEKWVRAHGADCRVAATVSVDAAGNVTGVQVKEATGDLMKTAGELLRQRVYQPYRVAKGAEASPVTLEVVVEGFNATPYVWLSRLLMAAIFVFFCVLTCKVWQRRAAQAPGGPSST